MRNLSKLEFWTHKFDQNCPFSKTLLIFGTLYLKLYHYNFLYFFLEVQIFKFFEKVGNTDTKSAPFFIEKKALIISMPILNNIKDVLCQATRLYKRVVQRHSLQHHHHEHQQLGASHQGGARGSGGV